jgi:hypothetical protein
LAFVLIMVNDDFSKVLALLFAQFLMTALCFLLVISHCLCNTYKESDRVKPNARESKRAILSNGLITGARTS